MPAYTNSCQTLSKSIPCAVPGGAYHMPLRSYPLGCTSNRDCGYRCRVAKAIGYRADDKRLELRGHALVLGMVLFLASELMFFSAWFATYYDLRGHNAVWPPRDVKLDTVESTVGTFFLGISSLFVWLAIKRIRKGEPLGARLWLGAALVSGGIFLAIAVHGWLDAHYGLS